MAKFHYKEYAKEVVEKLFEADDIEIYEKFIKEFERLTKQNKYKKEEVKSCGTCWASYGGHCCVKEAFVKFDDDACDKYESNKEVEKKIMQKYGGNK